MLQGTFAKGCLKVFFWEATPFHHHAGPSQPSRGFRVSWKALCSWGHWTRGKQGLRFLAGWSCMTMEGWEDSCPLWVCCVQRETPGASSRDKKTDFCESEPSDKDVPALFSSMTTNPLLICEPLPCFQNKRSVQGMPKCKWIKMKKSHHLSLCCS